MISVKIDLAPARRVLDGLARQVPYATARALTETARQATKDLTAATERAFDKPVPFTKRAFGWERASKANLTAVVYIRPKQAEYLLPQIIGGRRGLKRFERRFKGETQAPTGYFVPGPGVRLNVSGNLARGQIEKIAAQLNQGGKHGAVFAGVPRGRRGPFGIWARRAGKLTPLLIEIPPPTYRKRLDFEGVVRRTVARDFQRNFDRYLAEAMRTAR